MTIHKIQGATLSMAEIDIGRGIFECGQTYVALSRVKNMEGLYLSNFEPNKIKTNKKVKQFYQEIPEVEYEVEEEEVKDEVEDEVESENETLEPDEYINDENLADFTKFTAPS
jgi:ATP-dependent exoDNAse (exonuclease V) alpha subunit